MKLVTVMDFFLVTLNCDGYRWVSTGRELGNILWKVEGVHKGVLCIKWAWTVSGGWGGVQR